jgi:DNA-binding NarL/FixJ family response regulator
VTRVLIATASQATRVWFTAFRSRLDAVSIVDIVRPDAELAARIHEVDPDVVVLDLADSDLETLASALESVHNPALDIVLLMDGERRDMPPSELLRPGVRAVLGPQPSEDELESALRAVASGLVVLDPRVFPALVHNDDAVRSATSATGSATRSPFASRLAAASLTPREIAVLNALAEGYGNKQIAAHLGISEHTVKTHLAAIFEKLDASNRTEAVMAGARLGLVLL